MDGWDYQPEVAPEGMVKAAVAAGALHQDVAENLSAEEPDGARDGSGDST